MKIYLDDGLFAERVGGMIKIGMDQDPDEPKAHEVFVSLEAYHALLDYMRKQLEPKDEEVA